MKKSTLYYLFIALLGILTQGCYKDDACDEDAVTGVSLEVSSSSTTTEWVIKAPDDTTSLVSQDNISYSPGIPLDLNQTNTTLIFEVYNTSDSTTTTDTITFTYYQTKLEPISINCGFAPIFEITGYEHTTNILDSIILNDSIVTYDQTLASYTEYEDNVTIYY